MAAENPNVVEPESEREHRITRVFGVPARILFEAFSKPEHLLQWFGPKGYPLALCELDFRVGGKFRFAMKGPDGKLMTPFSGTYLEIVKDRAISYSSVMEEAGAETMVVTVSFEEHEGKTTLTQHTLFASVAMKRKHLNMGYEVGVGMGLDQLGEFARGLVNP
jgi:uncharacterized protein YndB with AHSA1/START domain